jgi:membrane-associated protease RseP (regulator of RpoE activity)
MPSTRRIRWLPIALYLSTILTTTAAGALLSGHNPFESLGSFAKGFPFSITLMIILTLHEGGHMLAARKHDLPVSVPYFIPAPTLIGTFGAIIRMPPVSHSRETLFDVGISGPIAGIVPSIAALAWGVHSSTAFHGTLPPGEGLSLGDSLLFRGLAALIGPAGGTHQTLVLDPVGFAGWMGILITAINLIPAGQLDGGHFFYSLWGSAFHRKAWFAVVALLIALGGLYWKGWWVWLAFVVLMGPGHPPVSDEGGRLSGKRRVLGYSMIAVEILIFVPVPFTTL